MQITVENIKCGGCANTVKKGLMDVLEGYGADQIKVDVETGTITIEGSNDALRDLASKKLLKMGYPESGSVDGLKAAASKAKSFASCAVGKMSSKV